MRIEVHSKRIDTLTRCLAITPICINQPPMTNVPQVALQYGSDHCRVARDLSGLATDAMKQFDSPISEVKFAALLRYAADMKTRIASTFSAS